jgi:phosphatidylglycerol:prolipoprotein diacylglycerol transferase
MWPVLFRIPLPEFLGGGSFPIRMFGVMVILGFLAGTWIITRRLRKVGVVREGRGSELATQTGTLTSEDVFDFCFYLLAVGILGSRLMYVLQNFGDFRGKLLDVFKIWQGGLVWYGGFALSALFAFWWLWTRKLPVLKVTDAAALGLALALAIGRWGCFFAGDDYGKVITEVRMTAEGKPDLDPDGRPYEDPVVDAAKAPWYAIQVPKDQGWRTEFCETPWSFREPKWLHPVQLYMSFKNFVVLGALLVIARNARRTGILTASYLMLYPVARFTIEFWRGDVDRGVDVLGTGMSFSQFFGIFVFLAGVGVLRAVKSRPMDAAPAAAS